MSRDPKRFALVTGASSGIGAIYADRTAKRDQDPAPRFVEHGGGSIIDIGSIVAVAPEILDGIYGGLEDVCPRVKPVTKTCRHAGRPNSVRRQHNEDDHKTSRFNATIVPIAPPNSAVEHVSATQTEIVSHRWSGYWKAVLEFLLEAFALYGALIHPTTDFFVSDSRPNAATGDNRSSLLSTDKSRVRSRPAP